MKAPRTTAILLTAALAVYLVVVGQIAYWLLVVGGFAVALGVGVVLLMAVGVWVVSATVWFGVRVERLARQLARERGLPGVSRLPVRPSGWVEWAEAIAFFEERKAELDEEPTDWRRWYRLAYAYDLAGDRPRARETMRQALRLNAGGGGSPATSAGPGSVTRPAG
jgi:tetratricopeptide (TPR) repeat protein